MLGVMGALLPSQHNRVMAPVKILGAALAAAALVSCSPSMNWRELRPNEGELVAMFPCKPDRMERSVTLAGIKTTMQLSSCSVEGVTYAITQASVDTPARVDTALAELREAAVANIGGVPGPAAPFVVPGMTPHARAERLPATGRHTDGSAVQEQVGFFSRGMRVYQATIVGPRIVPADAETFFGGLRFPA